MPQPSGPSSPPLLRLLQPGLLILTVVSCVVFVSRSHVDPDLWGHVQFGRDLLAHGLPSTTTYSYTADQHVWINHELLAEVLLAFAADTVGIRGLLAGQCLLAAVLLTALVWRGRYQGLSTITICLLALLVAAALGPYWVLRPQLLSYTYYTLLICLLGWCFRGWQGHCWISWFDGRVEEGRPQSPTAAATRLTLLCLALPLFALWANSHGGFLAGWSILVAYLGLRSWEVMACRGWRAWPVVGWLCAIGAGSGLATLFNPYGGRLHGWLANSLTVPRPEIADWRPPDLSSVSSAPLVLLLALVLVSLLVTRRSRDLTHLAILGLTLWQALEHRRHIPFFVIPCGLWMAVHVDSTMRRLNVARWLSPLVAKPSRQRTWAWLILGCLLLQLAKLDYRTRGIRVPRQLFPVAAFQYMSDRDLTGRIVVPYNWGQYAISAFGRGTQTPLEVSVDGRFRTAYPQPVLDMSFDFQAGRRGQRYRISPFHDQRVLEYGQPDLVLTYRYAAHAVNVMFRNQDSWTLLYQDCAAQLWGRRSRFGAADSREFIPFSDRLLTNDAQRGWVDWPAHPLPPDRTSVSTSSARLPAVFGG